MANRSLTPLDVLFRAARSYNAFLSLTLVRHQVSYRAICRFRSTGATGSSAKAKPSLNA